jgi:predicted dithiol-disulfide oxidoreductase (DUF899 family)
MTVPQVVSESEWRAELDAVRAKEKRATRERDALAAQRRRLPAVEIEKSYVLEGPNGSATLLDLFEGRRQLLLYHFMYAPTTEGWPEAGCPGCSMFVDQIGHQTHLHARDTSFALVSRAPLERLEAYRRRMGWTIPWYSSAESDFNRDFGMTRDNGSERFGLSVFLRDGDRVLRTYFTASRGVEALGSVWTFLDLTPLGRQEEWEDAPAGTPKGLAYYWWRRHDEYPSQGGDDE